jgi:hypothetical protein
MVQTRAIEDATLDIPEGFVGTGVVVGEPRMTTHRHLHRVHLSAMRSCWKLRTSS